MKTPDSTPGRRSSASRRRLDLTVVAAVLLPVLTVLAALLVHADGKAAPSSPPEESALTRSTVICPSADGPASVATVSGARGRLAARLGQRDQYVPIVPFTPKQIGGDGKPLVLTGVDDLAPSLLAGRFVEPLAAADCRPPTFDQWFTGVGAGARHHSVVELVNPDLGRAIVDIEVYGHNGPVDVPELRGLAVPGGERVRVDLSDTVPRRVDLALHVVTVRGRVSTSLADSFDQLGAGQTGSDWMAAQVAPSTTNLLLGLPGGKGSRKLTLANPGPDEGRATIRLVTAGSVFTPAGVKDVVLPPQSVVRVPMSKVLRAAEQGDDERPLGIQVESTVPATTSLVLFVDGDLVHAVPVPALTDEGAALLPPGGKRLVLGGASAPGVVTVSLWDERGRPLHDERAEVSAGRGFEVELPDKARLMTLTPARSSIEAVVLVTGDGAAMVRVRAPLTTGLVPQVRPGSP